MPKLLHQRLIESCAAIRSQRLQPKIGIVLGSGLGWLAERIQHAEFFSYDQIPHFPRSTAHGHAGRIVLGHFSGMPVMVMQGRAHLYEGHSVSTTTWPIRCMHRLGCRILVVSNASGGLNPRLNKGDVVAIDSHIDLMMRPMAEGYQSYMGLPKRLHVYDPGLIQIASQVAIRNGWTLPRATYLATLGPTYETRSEYRAFRFLGGDIVGMSTAPEAALAATLGMHVLGLSVVSNVANPDRPTVTTHDEVLEAGKQAQRKFEQLVTGVLSELSGPPD